MDRLLNFISLQIIVSEIRSKSSSFVTNYYPNEIKDTELIEKGQMYCYRDDNVCLVIRKFVGFNDFSYIATNYEALEHTLADFFSRRNGIYITDLVGMPTQIAPVKKLFEERGFTLRRSLQRMVKIGVDSASRMDSDHIVYPSYEDINDIREILLENFDPLSEQIPSIDELSRFIDKKHIYLYKNNNEIAGMIIFELTPVAFYLRYWFTNSKFRNMGIGSTLYKKVMFDSPNIKRQMLWVVADNENAIKRYEHYGFKLDRLIDNVMIINNN